MDISMVTGYTFIIDTIVSIDEFDGMPELSEDCDICNKIHEIDGCKAKGKDKSMQTKMTKSKVAEFLHIWDRGKRLGEEDVVVLYTMNDLNNGSTDALYK